MLQQAMASPMTQPVTDDDRARMQRFDAAFATARKKVNHDSAPLTDIIRGAQAAYAAILNRWHSHRGSTNWIHFNNIGEWGTAYLDRAALTEYIQVGNNRKAAYYADVFVDASGLPLESDSFAYAIQFTKKRAPRIRTLLVDDGLHAGVRRVGTKHPRQIPGGLVHTRPRDGERRIGNDLRAGRSPAISSHRQLAPCPEGLVQPSVPGLRTEGKSTGGDVRSAEDSSGGAAVMGG